MRTAKFLVFLIIIALNIILFSSLSFSLTNSITISAIPDSTRPTSGDSIAVLVYVDLSGESDLLGEYSFDIIWNPLVLEFQSISGGTTEGFTTLLSNATKGGDGILSITNIYPQGAGNLVHVATINYIAKGSPGAETNINFSVISLSAAYSYKDLEPTHSIEPGFVRINSHPVFITTSLPDAGKNLPYNVILNVSDPDIDDFHAFELMEGPDWMNINP